MAKQLRILDPDLARQALEADTIYIGNKLFVAVTVDDTEEASLSEAEVAMAKEALADQRPPLRAEEAVAYLRRRGKDLGLD